MKDAAVRIDRGQKYQTLRGFGASGAWWAQEVGGWSHIDEASGKPVRDRISELLHSKENGIGLSIYRYNIGAGSADSGKGDIGNPLRRAQCFEVSEGQYDWSRDANAVYMMRQAAKDGADELIVFANSPPERLTVNGKAHCEPGFRPNLKKNNAPAFARFLMDVTEHFIREGLPVKYVSPVNEPQWKWTGGQEGCHLRPRGVHTVLRACAEEMEKRPALKSVKLSGPENGDIRFFNKSYIRPLLNDKVVRRNLDAVDVHSYFTQIRLPLLGWFINDRPAFLRRFGRWMTKKYPGVPINMSEWTHMKGGRDSGMDSALEMAKIMFEDLALMNAVSWQHWIAVSEVDFCDGLIYINLADKTFELTKRYYATGNFSLFVERGAKRIEATCGKKQLLVLAFEKDGKITVIAINRADEPMACVFPPGPADLYVTDDNANLKKIPGIDAGDVLLSPRSVNTLVYQSSR